MGLYAWHTAIASLHIRHIILRYSNPTPCCLLKLAGFESVLGFRQQHKLRRYFDLSDLYFICRLTPYTYDIHPCQDEVIKCQWMKVEELAATQETTPLSHLTAQLLLKARDRGFDACDITMQEVEMNLPDYADSKSYKLFMKKPD